MNYETIKFNVKHVNLDVEEYEDHVYICSIVTEVDYRNCGLGTNALLQVIKYAEKVQKPLAAWVTNELGGDKEKLIQWYTKHGFYKEYNILNTRYNYNFRRDF